VWNRGRTPVFAGALGVAVGTVVTTDPLVTINSLPPVTEPGLLMILGIGLFALAALTRRTKVTVAEASSSPRLPPLPAKV